MKNIFFFLFFLLCGTKLIAQLPAYVPTNGLEAWYPFTGNADNANGTGKNGTVTEATLSTDRFGAANNAYAFDGDTHNIKIDTTFFNIGWSDYTISCWVNSDTLDNPYNFNNAQAIINTIPHNGVALYFSWRHSYKYGLYAGSNPPGGWDIMAGKLSSDPCVTHTWNHLVFVKQNDTSYSFYINGILDTMYHSPVMASALYCKMVLGRSDPAVIQEGFYGKLDDYGIWKSALTSCDVRRLYQSQQWLYLTAQPSNVSAAPTSTATFSVTDTGTGTTYQWQVNTGSGYTNLTGATPYSGVTTPTLTITPVASAMNNNKYRCVVAGSGGCADSSDFGKLTVWATGVDNLTYTQTSIVPNPTTGDLYINSAENVDIKVFNSVGSLIKSATQTKQISISGLPAALYLVKLYDEKGMLIYVDKIVKQ